MRLALTTAFVLFVCYAVGPAASQPGHIAYDDFMTMSEQDRLRVFNEVSPSNRAALVREQIVRWSLQNAARLTAEQRQFLDDVQGAVKAEAYDPTHPERARFQAELKLFESRVRALFSVEDARQAFTIHGRHIPPR